MDDQKLPESAATSPDIPTLQKKEEERKKGGAWFSRAGGSGSTVRVGASAARSPSGLLGSLERVAQNIARSVGTGNPLGRLLMSRAGAWLVLAGACAPAALFLAAGILGRPDTTARYGASSALSAPHSSQAGRTYSARTGGGALSMVADANKGVYDEPASPSADAPAASASAAAPAADAASAPAEPAAPAAPAGGLAHESFARKLSGAVGGGGGSGGSAPAGRLADKGIEMKLANNFKAPLAGGGKLSALQRSPRMTTGKRLSAVRGKTNKAMGQLKLADNLSRAGARSGGDASRQYAADAFDQQRSQGAATEGGGLGAGAVTTPSGESAPDVTQPSVGAGQNVTPYQDKLDAAKSSSNMALMLTILGAALIALGIYFLNMPDPFEGSKIIGWALIGVGSLIILMGLMSANAAKQKAQDIKDQYGQKDQGKIAEDCANQATNKQDCKPKQIDQKSNTVKQDATVETNATYDNGGPVGQ